MCGVCVCVCVCVCHTPVYVLCVRLCGVMSCQSGSPTSLPRKSVYATCVQVATAFLRVVDVRQCETDSNTGLSTVHAREITALIPLTIANTA